MKSIAMKFAAIVLAAVWLLSAVACAGSIVLLAQLELYDDTPEQLWQKSLEQNARKAVYDVAANYASRLYSNAPEELLPFNDAHVVSSCAGYKLWLNGEVIASGGGVIEVQNPTIVRVNVTPSFIVVVPVGTTVPETWQVWGSSVISDGVRYREYLCEDLTFQAEVELLDMRDSELWGLLELLYTARNALPLYLALSLLALAACMVYLCWAAGRKPKCDEIRPGALNALPLDLYAAVTVPLFAGGSWVLCKLGYAMVEDYFNYPLLGLFLLLGLLLCLLPVAVIFAAAAQIKAGNHYWWRRSMVGFVVIRLWRGLRWCCQGGRAMVRMLPTIWQWLLTAAVMVLVPLLLLVLTIYSPFFLLPLLVSLAMDVALLCYGGWCFGTIVQGARRMAQGDLQMRIDDTRLYGSYRDCARQLNSLSGAAQLSAREQLKSERMKTELITNVSHDIKTPLTSIINYVDLLRKPHTEQEREQYLDVLSRQSARLKKLIEDLTEMSRATTGNITAEITRVDAAEAVHQALGEFSDKLAARQLTPVFRQPEQPVLMQADGRLTWRVMSNLLSNAVKYAMPGTRLYVDVVEVDNQVLISFKNISAEPLNISAEELMERFVRGDAARNTEGSGLGLNIARGLMEVQHGSLQLLVDGDLFKVTILFLRS